MRTMLSTFALLLVLTAGQGLGRLHADRTTRPAAAPVLGAWRFVGTAPPGFTRQGTEVARLTLSRMRQVSELVVVKGLSAGYPSSFTAAH